MRILPVEDLSIPDAALSVALRDQLERGFRRLPPEQRAVFAFRHYLGLTEPEIATQLELPLGTVKSRLHYARVSMRAALEADLRPARESTRERLA